MKPRRSTNLRQEIVEGAARANYRVRCAFRKAHLQCSASSLDEARRPFFCSSAWIKPALESTSLTQFPRKASQATDTDCNQIPWIDLNPANMTGTRRTSCNPCCAGATCPGNAEGEKPSSTLPHRALRHAGQHLLMRISAPVVNAPHPRARCQCCLRRDFLEPIGRLGRLPRQLAPSGGWAEPFADLPRCRGTLGRRA